MLVTRVNSRCLSMSWSPTFGPTRDSASSRYCRPAAQRAPRRLRTHVQETCAMWLGFVYDLAAEVARFQSSHVLVKDFFRCRGRRSSTCVMCWPHGIRQTSREQTAFSYLSLPFSLLSLSFTSSVPLPISVFTSCIYMYYALPLLVLCLHHSLLTLLLLRLRFLFDSIKQALFHV